MISEGSNLVKAKMADIEEKVTDLLCLYEKVTDLLCLYEEWKVLYRTTKKVFMLNMAESHPRIILNMFEKSNDIYTLYSEIQKRVTLDVRRKMDCCEFLSRDLFKTVKRCMVNGRFYGIEVHDFHEPFSCDLSHFKPSPEAAAELSTREAEEKAQMEEQEKEKLREQAEQRKARELEAQRELEEQQRRELERDVSWRDVSWRDESWRDETERSSRRDSWL